MSAREVEECLKAWASTSDFQAGNVLGNVRLMVGVLVSSKTLQGERNRWPGRYPRIGAIPEIFSFHAEAPVLNTIHYNTDDPAGLSDQVRRIVELVGAHRIHAIQLNVFWPDPELVREIRRRYPDLRLILQIGGRALGYAVEAPGDHAMNGLHDLVWQYSDDNRNFFDDFLVDPSGGHGQSIDLEFARRCIDVLPNTYGRGIAGGFTAETVIGAYLLMVQYGLLNVDAEGRLRTSQEEGDHLDLEKARAYIRAAIGVYGKVISRQPT